jgi:cell division protein FtsL
MRAVLKRVRVPRRLTVGLSGSLHTRGVVLWVAALVTGILCVSQHVYSAKLAEQIEGLRNDREVVETEIGFLMIERARLSGRERIEEYATERLGMRYPEAHEVVRLGDGIRNPWDRWGDDLVEGSTIAVNDG